MKKLNSVQYLRAIAAILVVITHVLTFTNETGNILHARSFQYFCAIGVDVFFVISGFIIAYTTPATARGGAAAAAFAKKRLIRIVPIYYIASAVYLLRYAAGLLSFIPAAHVVIDTFTLIKTVTILPLFDRGAEMWPTVLTLAWTLSDELFFYIIFSMLILLRVSNRNYWLAGIIALLAVLGTLFPTTQLQWEFATNYMILEFAFGVIICLLYQHLQKTNFTFAVVLTIIAISGLTFIAFSPYCDNVAIAGDGFAMFGYAAIFRVLWWGIPSALLVSGMVFMEKAIPGRLFKNKIMLLLGDASYSIYLTHGLTFMAIGMIINRFTILKHLLPAVLFVLVAFVIALINGSLVYKFVEKPLLNRLSRLFLKPKNKTILNPI